MNLIRLTSPEDGRFARAMELYGLSFPFHEQREAPSQRAILSWEDYHFDLVYEEGLFAGLVLRWETAEWTYLEHFCIEPGLRNRRLGQRVLEKLRERGKPLILEIDPPEDGLSRRRLGFYLRSGFVENPFPHVHPPYHQGARGHRLVVLSAPRALSRAEYDGFYAYLKARVMSAET